MAEDKPIQFGIREIKELEFFVDETKEMKGTFDFNYKVDLFPDPNTELIKIVITASYTNVSSKELFLKGKISTVFSIKDMKSYTKRTANGKVVLEIPEAVWITLFSMAFTHARAVLARSAAGTTFTNLLMPVINPQQEFKKLFGEFLAQQTA